MKTDYWKLFLWVSSFYFISCNNTSNQISSNKIISRDSVKRENIMFMEYNSMVEPTRLGRLGSKNNLVLLAYASECGEFGGHKESLAFFSDDSLNLKCKFQYFDINKDSCILAKIPKIDKVYNIKLQNRSFIYKYIGKVFQLRLEAVDLSHIWSGSHLYCKQADNIDIQCSIYWEFFKYFDTLKKDLQIK